MISISDRFPHAKLVLKEKKKKEERMKERKGGLL